jgi:predicted PurR-regulated permease PerM
MTAARLDEPDVSSLAMTTPSHPVKVEERRALGFLALVALAALVRLALPVGVGLLLGALLAFALEPVYGGLRRRGMKAGAASLTCALGATVIVSGGVLALTTLLVTRGMALWERSAYRSRPAGPSTISPKAR